MTMSCFGGGRRNSAQNQEAIRAKKQSDAIERQIKLDARRSKKEIKILLLGAGESGKSTVVKQMRVIHKNGFDACERRVWKNILFQNLVDAFLLLFELVEAEGGHIESSQGDVCTKFAVECHKLTMTGILCSSAKGKRYWSRKPYS
jgi:hypothetical protein